MDYEKAYKTVLKTAKQWIKDGCTDKEKICLECVFPELRESENERIRKEMVDYFSQYKDDGIRGVDITPWIAYLEKQKELPFVKDVMLGYPGLYFYDGERMHFRGPAMKEKQKEQKPNIELIQRSWYMEGYHDGEFGKEPKWVIKTGEGGPKHELNPRYGEYIEKEQKPVEWSEENEKIMDTIVSVLGQYIDYKAVSGTGSGYATPRYSKEIDWLKSLRPQPHWKPSEEQMEALKKVTGNAVDADEYYPALATLYYELKEQF